MRYTVERGDQVVTLKLPLVHWDVVTYWRGRARSMTEVCYLCRAIRVPGGRHSGLLAQPGQPGGAGVVGAGRRSLDCLFHPLDLLPQTIADNFVNPAASISLAFLIGLTFTILLPPAFIRFALVFPRPSPLLVSHPWLALVPYARRPAGSGCLFSAAICCGLVLDGR